MEIAIAIVLFVVGAAMGSFACCQAWRMKKRDKSRWSHCMKCEKRIRWWDNVPVVSWLLLRGKCRRCGAKIGVAEVLSEVLMGVAYVLLYLLWFVPRMADGGWQIYGVFALLLLMLVGMGILFVYDAKWRELPQAVLTFCLVCGMLILSLRTWWCIGVAQFSWGAVGDVAGALAILPGLYFVLYKASRERWVGSGDWWLAMAIALVLQSAWLALCCVFVANLMASVVGLVGKKRKMAFGPYLIVGFVVVFLAQDFLLSLV